jgi:hypothetical protein
MYKFYILGNILGIDRQNCHVINEFSGVCAKTCDYLIIQNESRWNFDHGHL